MTTTMQRLLTGKTRLPEFGGEWETKRIGDLLTYERPDRYIVQHDEYVERGDAPVLTANKSFVLGYTNETFGVCVDFPVIIFDDFTADCKYVTVPFKVKSSAIKLLRPKNGVNLRYMFERMQLIDFPVSDHRRYYISDYQNVEITLPTYDEQVSIAEALSDVDGLIESLESLIAKKRAVKAVAGQQLLTGKTRLPGFCGEWKTKRLGEIANIDPENLSDDTNPDYEFNYISLEQVETGRLHGYTEETFRSSPSRARRKLRHNDVLMATVRPNLMGHLLFNEQLADTVCSTGFAVLRCKDSLSVPEFLFAHLLGSVVNKQIEAVLAGSNYPAISSCDVALVEIPCPPTVREQVAVGTVLSDMDAEIATLERRLDKVRALKQGMMQQLLTGKIRLVDTA